MKTKPMQNEAAVEVVAICLRANTVRRDFSWSALAEEERQKWRELARKRLEAET